MSTETTYRPPRRRPGHESLEKLLLAAEEQLRQEELDFFTVDRVLERAGVSIGSFYARFPGGKDALLNTVQDRLHARVQPAILEALEAREHGEESLDQAVDHVFGILIEHVLREREITRAFVMFSAFDPVLRHKGQLVNLERRDAVAKALLVHREEIAHTDPVAAIYLAFSMFQAVMHGRLLFFAPHSGLGLGVSTDEIFGEVKLWIANYLRGGHSGPDRVIESLTVPVSE